MSVVIDKTIDLVRYATWGIFESSSTGTIYDGDSPSSIIASVMVQTLQNMTNPVDGDAWPLYISSIPDAADVVDECGGIYDTPGVIDGRMLSDGEVVEHHGIQIKIRSKDYETGYTKIRGLALDLDALYNEVMVIGSNTYTVNNLARFGTIGYLGVEPESKKRHLFTVNFIACINGL